MKIAGIILAVAALAVAAVSFAGTGSGFSEGTLKPQCMARVSIPVAAKEAISIQVRGNGGDLDCYLYRGKEPGQPFGKFVTRDDTSKDGCDLRATSVQGETFLLLVQNTSNHDEHYTVSTN